MARSLTVTLMDDEGCETEVTFPARYVVCHACEGSGKVLVEGLRGVAFTQEDFAEDPDFLPSMMAGAYDVMCPTCKGANVVLEGDPERMTRDQKATFERWQEQEEDRERERRADVHTMRMESGCWE